MQLTKFLGALCLGTVLAFAAAPASAAYPLKVAGGPATGAYLPFANAMTALALGMAVLALVRIAATRP